MTNSLPCPVCEKPAAWAESSTGDFAEVDCLDCGHFRISGTLQQVLADYPTTERREALERARLRARYGSVPVITTYNLP